MQNLCNMVKDLSNFIERFEYVYTIVELVEDKCWEELKEHLIVMKYQSDVGYKGYTTSDGLVSHPIIAKVLFPLVIKYESHIDLFTEQLLESLFYTNGMDYKECINYLIDGWYPRNVVITPFLKAIKNADKKTKSLINGQRF